MAATLGPAERRALREIVQPGDLTEVEGKVYLVAAVSAATIDALAAFEAEGEDMELDASDLELDTSDLELDHDNEPDDPLARQRFIEARRVRVTLPAWRSPSGHLVSARVEYRPTGAGDRGAGDHRQGRWLRLPACAPAAGKARRR